MNGPSAARARSWLGRLLDAARACEVRIPSARGVRLRVNTPVAQTVADEAKLPKVVENLVGRRNRETCREDKAIKRPRRNG